MSIVSANTVQKVATDLSHINISLSELEGYTAQLGGILDLISQLLALSTENVKPTYNVLSDLSLTMRKDVVEVSDTGSIIRNSPYCESNCFVVPKVVE